MPKKHVLAFDETPWKLLEEYAELLGFSSVRQMVQAAIVEYLQGKEQQIGRAWEIKKAREELESDA